jgi:hypothetical protein
MRSEAAGSRFSDDVRHSRFEWDAAETPDLAVAMTHQIAQAVMEIVGPLFWVALVVGFVAAECGLSFGR